MFYFTLSFHIVVCRQAELFSAPTQKKEAAPNLRMVAYLEKEASELTCYLKVFNLLLKFIFCVTPHEWSIIFSEIREHHWLRVPELY